MAEHEKTGGAGQAPAPPTADPPGNVGDVAAQSGNMSQQPEEAVVTEETVAEETQADETSTLDETPAEETHADETSTVDETPAEEALAQDAAVEGPEIDLEQLTAQAEKAAQYLELAQRTKADFENYRRRAAREAAAAQDRGVAKLAKELLPAVDNLDRALAAAEQAGESDNGTATLVSGIKLVHADVIAALARAGIEPFSPHGEPFNPQHHEAVAQQPVEGAEPGTVVEVYQRGYRFGDAVLRPARVVVAG
jgi:molecular chaperone GrpE